MSADWPSAAEWLASSPTASARTGAGAVAGDGACVVVAGVPLVDNAVTAGCRYDLTPAAVRARLARFSSFDGEHGVALPPVRDLGDDVHAPSLDARLTILLGGHNGVTFEALRRRTDLDRWGLLTLDAHHDARPYEPGPPGNGSPVRALVAAGLPGSNIIQVGIGAFTNSPHHRAWCQDQGITILGPDRVGDVPRCLDDLAKRADLVYVDLDVDVLDRAFAPACPGSRAGGIRPRELFDAAFAAGSHPSVRAIDIVEVDASADIASITVDAAATCLLSAAAGFATR